MADNSTSILQKRERAGRNIITLLLLAGAGAAVFYFWGLLVPWLLDVAVNTTKLVGLVGVLGLITYAVLDPRMRMLALYGYRSFTRMLTNQIIDIDPIGMLNTYVSRLKERLAEMDESIGSLKGQRDQLASLIEKNETERIQQLRRAEQASKVVKQGGEQAAAMRSQIALSGRQAGRLGKSNETLKNLLERIDVLLKALMKMRESSDVLIQDIQQEVTVRTQEHNAVTKGFNAFTKAQRIMATGGAEKEIYDMTLEKLTNDYAEKMGQIETFMDLSKNVVNGIDLDNMGFEEDALAQLEAWEKKSGGILGSPGAGGTDVHLRVGAQEPPPGDFSDLFDTTHEGQNEARNRK